MKYLELYKKRDKETYSDMLWKVLFYLFDLLNDEEILNISSSVEKLFETINNIEAGENGYDYEMIYDDELKDCISDINIYLVKNKIEI